MVVTSATVAACCAAVAADCLAVAAISAVLVASTLICDSRRATTERYTQINQGTVMTTAMVAPIAIDW